LRPEDPHCGGSHRQDEGPRQGGESPAGLSQASAVTAELPLATLQQPRTTGNRSGLCGSGSVPNSVTTKGVAYTAAQLGLFLETLAFTLRGLQPTHSRLLVGSAFGCYGLAMAVLQVSLGRISDRIERRKVLLWGMAPFILGSFPRSTSVSGFLLMLTGPKDKPPLPCRPSGLSAPSPLL
jgi:hypothetical protein